MARLAELFTPARRKAIYGLAASALALLVVFGTITPGQEQHWLAVASGVIAALTNLMAFLNTDVRVG